MKNNSLNSVIPITKESLKFISGGDWCVCYDKDTLYGPSKADFNRMRYGDESRFPMSGGIGYIRFF